MMMNDLEKFTPNWASPPGDTIVDILSHKKSPIEYLSNELDLSAEFATGLISGKEKITDDLASELERLLGASKRFWLKRDFDYRNDLKRQSHNNTREVMRDWLAELPVREMIKFGWINPNSGAVPDRAKACLGFFSVPDIDGWYEKYSSVERTVAFRSTTAFESKLGSVAAWLTRGEIVASQTECEPWNADRFRQTLAEIRLLSMRRKPSRFLEKLKSLCAESGVALTLVRAPSGCRASGATKFLSSSKALILMSFRYRTDDHFWFTFFHEAGHLLLHNKDATFLEGADFVPTHEEEEANEFAAEVLIPNEVRSEMAQLGRNYRAIIRFARQIGVSPGIVVGQLQYRGRIDHNQLNYLKTRFDWSDMK